MSYSLPTTIQIGENSYKIRNNGDFRTVLDCFEALGDIELDNTGRIEAALIIFYEDIDTIEEIFALFKGDMLAAAIKEMFNFFNCGISNIGAENQYKLIDWQQDEQMICAAVNQVAGKEIRNEQYIHWWTFMGYYISVGESVLATVVSIRHKLIKGAKLEKYEQKFINDNPQYFAWKSISAEQEEFEKEIAELWGKKEG